MSTKPNATADSTPTRIYQISVQGQLDPTWANWFDNMNVTQDSNGNTLLTGPIADQAALHGLLKKVRDLGMTLLSVNSTLS